MLHYWRRGCGFNPFGQGLRRSIVVPTFSTAEDQFAGQQAFVVECGSGWCTGHVRSLGHALLQVDGIAMAMYRGQIRAARNEQAMRSSLILILGNAQIRASSEAA